MSDEPNGARPGEHLQNALDEARQNARQFRKKATEAEAEADRWEAVANQLLEAMNMTKTPVAFASKRTSLPSPPGTRRPHGFWHKEIETILEAWPVGEKGPTRKELCDLLVVKHPGSNPPTVMVAIGNLINRKKILWKVDNLYLPGREPGAAA